MTLYYLMDFKQKYYYFILTYYLELNFIGFTFNLLLQKCYLNFVLDYLQMGLLDWSLYLVLNLNLQKYFTNYSFD